MKKQILTIAVIMALPFAANATDPAVGPAHDSGNKPVIATASAPYVTQTPTADDATHIASTAYVKGAYNDSIAAVNKVANTVSDLSDTVDSLSDYVNNDIEDEIENLRDYVEGDFYDMVAEKQDKLHVFETEADIEPSVIGDELFDNAMRHYVDGENLDLYLPDGGANHLITANAVAMGISDFVSLFVLDNPIPIYTTWDTNATTTVALSEFGQ